MLYEILGLYSEVGCLRSSYPVTTVVCRLASEYRYASLNDGDTF